MVSSTSAPAASPNRPTNFKARLLKLVGLVFLAAVIIILGLYFYGSHQTQNMPKNAVQDYTYTYQKLAPYKLTGLQAGRGAQFDIPIEFNAAGISAPKTQQAQLGQYPLKDQRAATIAQIAVAATPAKAQITKTYLDNFAKTITNSKSKGYTAHADTLKQFILQRMATGYSISLAKTNSLSTPYLKNNAWSASFSAVSKTGQNTATLPNFSGQVILAIGKDTFYYFMVGAVDYNWRGNQAVWQQIIDSLKIDQ